MEGASGGGVRLAEDALPTTSSCVKPLAGAARVFPTGEEALGVRSNAEH